MTKLTNQAKYEIKTMSSTKLKNFRPLVVELMKHENEQTAEYFKIMLQAIDDELYERKEIIE